MLELLVSKYTEISDIRIIVAWSCTVLLLVWRLSRAKLDPREPHLLPSWMPFIGHNAAMVWQGQNFWTNYHAKHHDLPIATLPVADGKMYVITSPKLVSAMFASRTLQLAPFLQAAISGWAPLSSRATSDFGSSLRGKWLKILPQSLAGASAARLHTDVLGDVRLQLDMLPHGGTDVADLGTWLRDLLSRSILVGFAGRRCDWCCDKKLIDVFWEYEWNLVHFDVGPLPSVTAPRAYEGREYALRQLESWLESMKNQPKGTDSDLSDFAKALLNLVDDLGWSIRDKACIAFVMIRAAISNEVQTFFWFFAHIYSNAELLSRLRIEAEEFLVLSNDAVSQDSISMTLSTIEAGCPLLVSCYKETQRLVTIGPIPRRVVEDTILSDGEREYLLKQGASVYVPLIVNHKLGEIWGEDADRFNPNRFMRDGKLAHAPEGTFYPFGGGRDVCPGRNLASNMLCWTMLTLLVGADIQALNAMPINIPERGKMPPTNLFWRLPQKTNMAGRLCTSKDWKKVKLRLFARM